MTCCRWDLKDFYLFFHIVKLYYETRMLQLLGEKDVKPLQKSEADYFEIMTKSTAIAH